MNATKPCKDRFEDIVALVMGELDPAAARELQDHIALCDTCRAGPRRFGRRGEGGPSGFRGTCGPASGRSSKRCLKKRSPIGKFRVAYRRNHFLERVKSMILAHKRLIVAAATVTALAASVVLYVSLVSSSTTAYALEQTVQANRHVHELPRQNSPRPGEWARCGCN